MKSQYNPNKHHRKSIRLKGYDYAKEGLYFITVCCQDRICLFGEVKDGKMMLNDAGKVAEECWLAIPNHFPNVVLHEHVVMPNHIHGVIEIAEDKRLSSTNAVVRAKNISPPSFEDEVQNLSSKSLLGGAKNLSPLRTVGSIVRGFKIGVTKWMRQNTKIYDVWHRNYYEHIIRNEQAYNNISNYIINNPTNWEKDKFYYKV